jgi:hypothetical protein
LEEKKLLVGMQILNAFVISSRNIGGSIPRNSLVPILPAGH